MQIVVAPPGQDLGTAPQQALPDLQVRHEALCNVVLEYLQHVRHPSIGPAQQHGFIASRLFPTCPMQFCNHGNACRLQQADKCTELDENC